MTMKLTPRVDKAIRLARKYENAKVAFELYVNGMTKEELEEFLGRQLYHLSIVLKSAEANRLIKETDQRQSEKKDAK